LNSRITVRTTRRGRQVPTATDIVGAFVVEGRRHDLIVSSDEGDLEAIAAPVSRHLVVVRLA
jgi:hypothetical protein